MSAVTTIQALLQLGVAVKDGFLDAKKTDQSMDWDKFMSSNEFKNIESDVGRIVSLLTKTELDEAIAAIQEKKVALLAGRQVVALSNDELLQYSDLTHTRSSLTDRNVDSVTASAKALAWVVEQLLPQLLTAAKVIIPLLI